jgi:hypothetical protein
VFSFAAEDGKFTIRRLARVIIAQARMWISAVVLATLGVALFLMLHDASSSDCTLTAANFVEVKPIALIR